MKVLNLLMTFIVFMLVYILNTSFLYSQNYNVKELAKSAQKRNKSLLIRQNPLDNSVGKTITLNQNYPNPFNPITTISFNTKFYESIELTVYDFLGREIDKLINKELKPGIYNISFNGSNLASGVYFYTIKSKGLEVTKMMILLK